MEKLKKLVLLLYYLSGVSIIIMCITNCIEKQECNKQIVADTIYISHTYSSNNNIDCKFIKNDSIDIYKRYSIDRVFEKINATVYHALEEQTNKYPLITASGLKIKNTKEAYSHRYIAVSQDFIKQKKLSYGDFVLLTGFDIIEYNGIWLVADCMNIRYLNSIDLLINPGMKGDYWKGDRVINMYKLGF